MRVPTEQDEKEWVARNVVPAGIVATAVGLLADFLVLREGQTKVDLIEFIDWLRSHDHPEFAQRIQSDPAVFDAFHQTLQEGHGQLITRLEFLDEGLILLSGTDGPFSAIAKALRPDLAVKVHRR